MKLYNIFESIILEEKKTLLTEGSNNNVEEIKKAIEGKYNVNFEYNDGGVITPRYVQIYQFGNMLRKDESVGDLAISGYQLGGKTKPTKKDSKNYGFKFFLEGKIVAGSVKPTGMKWYKPVSDLPSYTDPKASYRANNPGKRFEPTHQVDFMNNNDNKDNNDNNDNNDNDV